LKTVILRLTLDSPLIIFEALSSLCAQYALEAQRNTDVSLTGFENLRDLSLQTS